MKINLGAWNRIFAVPSVIIDDHITKCGAAQLKVLLYLLRYPDKDIPIEEIAEKLSLNKADVSDSLNYWIAENIICSSFEDLSCCVQPDPYENISNLASEQTIQTFKPIDIKTNNSPALSNLKSLNEIESDEIQPKMKPSATAPRLTLKEALSYIDKDENLKYLIDEAPKILKRNITSTDIIVIISFMNWTNMDVDLAMMMMNYCVLKNKFSAKALEKEAYKWSNLGIDSHEKADDFIKANLELDNIQKDIMYAFHKEMLSEREKTFIEKWVRDFKFDIKMIKLAHERAMTRKGEKDFSYINGILASWFKKGLSKPEEVDDENSVKTEKQKSKSSQKETGFFKLESSSSFSLDDLKAKAAKGCS